MPRGVRGSQGAVRDALAHHGGVCAAVDDAELCQALKRFEPGAPDFVSERGFGNHAHTGFEQELEHIEEHAEGSQSERIPRRGLEPGNRMNHALLDLVPADRWTRDQSPKLVREGGLARADGPADDHKRRERHAIKRLP